MKTKTEKKSCRNCGNAIFDDHWGEYKCKKTHHRVYSPDDKEYCIDYKKGEPTLTAKKGDDYDQI